MNSQVDAVLKGLDFYLDREAAGNQGRMPEFFPVHIADLALLHQYVNLYPAIERNGEDYYYRGVRLLRDDATFRVRLDIPSPNQKPDPVVQAHSRVLGALCEHWKQFEEKNEGRMPSRTYLAPRTMEDYVGGVRREGAQWRHYLDTGELECGKRAGKTFLKVDDALPEMKFRSEL